MKTPIVQGRVHIAPNDGAIHVEASICGTTFFQKDKTPHWQRYGDGSATMELTGAIYGNGESKEAKEQCWLQFDTSECGEKSSKRTMVCLHGRKDIERLRDMCDLILGDVRT